jgi:glycyl-tRNA synthetase
MPEQPSPLTMEKLVSLCQRRGFIFPSSDIYGGLSGCWDYGPVGVELKRNVKEAWWQAVVQERDDMVGLDTAVLMNRRVWEASGHVTEFHDPLVECKECHKRFRADQLETDTCPECGGPFTEPRQFNLMFKTSAGPVESEDNIVYLRPETAQGIFVNFQNVVTTTRRRLPFGIAQQGKAFRNEITTGNFIFRSREFEQMEIEYFVKPGTDAEWFEHWLQARLDWYVRYGIKRENLEVYEHPREKLSHYARRVCDINYRYPMGFDELEGLANRTDFDLGRHAVYSGKSMEYYDSEADEHYIPYVIEPSAGVDRAVLAFLCDAYEEEPDKDEIRTVLHFHPDIAPIKVAVLPLSKKEHLNALARDVFKDIRACTVAQYDDTQSIGRRYRRQDEIGTPFCVTVDFESLEDKAVTIRERDTMNQIRIPIEVLRVTLAAKLSGEPLFTLPPGGKIWKEERKPNSG